MSLSIVKQYLYENYANLDTFCTEILAYDASVLF